MLFLHFLEKCGSCSANFALDSGIFLLT
jgi:hypothetical protein